MIWSSHGIWCGFEPNFRRFGTWNEMEFSWESMSYFLQGCSLILMWTFWRGSDLECRRMGLVLVLVVLETHPQSWCQSLKLPIVSPLVVLVLVHVFLPCLTLFSHLALLRLMLMVLGFDNHHSHDSILPPPWMTLLSPHSRLVVLFSISSISDTSAVEISSLSHPI